MKTFGIIVCTHAALISQLSAVKFSDKFSYISSQAAVVFYVQEIMFVPLLLFYFV